MVVVVVVWVSGRRWKRGWVRMFFGAEDVFPVDEPQTSETQQSDIGIGGEHSGGRRRMNDHDNIKTTMMK